jgi:type VI secretion system protein ImpJ
MEAKYNFTVLDPVQWYEGQLLYPQHYQQMRNELQQTGFFYLSVACPWYWGIRQLDLDETSLAGGIIRINQVLAIMPDGSVVEKKITSPRKIELDISSLKQELDGKVMTLHLAVVNLQPDAANTAGDLPRYDSVESSPIVDENTGDEPITMPKLSLRVFLLKDEDVSARYSSFPLLKVTFRNNMFTTVDFIPPSTSLQQGGYINLYCGELIKNLRKDIAYLSDRLRTLATEETAPLLEYYSRVYNIIVSRIVVLEAFYLSEKVHPFEIYRELCISAGTYCSLSQGEVPPIFDPYNHNDLKASFDPVIAFIQSMIKKVKNPAIPVLFQKNGRVFSCPLKEEWLASKTLIIGVKVGSAITPALASRWLRGAIIASQSVIPEAKEKRILGADRTLVQQVASLGLLESSIQILASIPIDPEFIKPREDLQIFNPSDTDETRPEEITLYIAG